MMSNVNSAEARGDTAIFAVLLSTCRLPPTTFEIPLPVPSIAQSLNRPVARLVKSGVGATTADVILQKTQDIPASFLMPQSAGRVESSPACGRGAAIDTPRADALL